MARHLFLTLGMVFSLVFSGEFTARQTSIRAPDPVEPKHLYQTNPTNGLPASPIEIDIQSQSTKSSSENITAPNMRFDCLTAVDGLSFSMGTSILQDLTGYMWFGTRYGLDKYDGNNFSVYLPGPADDLMSGNFIINLNQDPNGDMWIATAIDLVRWNKETGEFVHYQADYSNPESLLPGRINSFGRDSNRSLLIGTNTGLNRYNSATDTFSRYLVDQPVLDIFIDHLGGIWLGTVEGVLYYSSGSFEQSDPLHYRADRSNPDKPTSDVVTSIYEDQRGIVWVGTDGGGLNRLDRTSGLFTPYAISATESINPQGTPNLSNNRVWSILEDSNGRLWIATQDGLNLLDQTTGNIYQYHVIPGDSHSLIDDAVFDLYQDRSGMVWIATMGGICKLNEIASRFTYYQQGPSQSELLTGAQPGNTSILSDNKIGSIYQDSHGILWVGTSTGGLNRLDRSDGSVMVYKEELFESSSLSVGEVSAILEDSAGTLWIGTSMGLSRYDPQKGTFESEPALHGMPIGSIAEDQQGNLWLGTWEGLYRRENGMSTFSPVSLKGGLQTLRRIQKLKLDRTGALWISTQADGLFRLDHAAEAGSTSTLIHFPQISSDPSSPGGSPMMDIYEDPNSTIWMGTVDDGLVRYDRDAQTFDHYIPNPNPTREVTISRYISCIQMDVNGFLWMGTALGMARFDPRNEIFSYFDTRDGLEVGEGISCTQSKQGEMFFGSWQGLITFFPDQIHNNPSPPTVVITALNLRNQVLRTDLSTDEYVKLSYRDNYISFDFVALDYAAPTKNQYAYKMTGLDPVWVEIGNRQHVDFPDLKPGNYTFRVAATNNSGIWSDPGTFINITITPPYWQTWWFKGLMGLMCLGVVAGGVWLRLKGVEARRRDLETQISRRTSELVTLVAQLTGLQETTKAVASTLELDSLLILIVQQATTLLNADGGFVNLVDKDEGVDEVFAVTGLAPPIVGKRTPLNSRLSGWATLHNQAVISNQILDDDRVARSVHSWLIEHHIQSTAVAPLTVRDKVLGTLLVIGQAGGKDKFTQPDLDLLVAFANQAAIAIENATLYEQSKELAVLEERSRLARELHDAVTQTLFSASLVAEALPTTWEKDPQEGRGLLQELRSLSRGALAEMRTLLLELRPAALLETSLADLLRQLGEAASGRTGIPISVQVEGQAKLPSDVHIAFYRITQEALNNVAKHARANRVIVRLSYPVEDQAISMQIKGDDQPGETGQSVLLSIRDDGRGFDPDKIPHNRLGLSIMQERAKAIGATLSIESQPGNGTQITVQWKQEN